MLNTSECQRAPITPLVSQTILRWRKSSTVIYEVTFYYEFDLNLKGNIWKLLWLYLFHEICLCKNSAALKVWCFCSSLPWDVFLYLLSTSWASKDLNIFLWLLLSWQPDFMRLCFVILLNQQSLIPGPYVLNKAMNYLQTKLCKCSS